MKVRDFINLLRIEAKVEMRKGNYFLCFTKTDCEGITPYLDKKINNLFINKDCSIVIDLEEEE